MDRFAAIQTFLAVVDAGSFSAAARNLSLGQPAVSKSIAQLERQLGVQLLLRSTRGLAPTDAGLRFYEHGRRALEEADQAEQAARGESAALRGQLRVSAAVTFARLHVIPHLPEFLRLHPGIEVDVVLDDRNIEMLSEGVELALRMGDLPDSSFTARKLAASPRMVVATPEYLRAHGEPRTPSELAAHEVVVYRQGGGGASWSFHRDGCEVPVVVRGRVSVSAAEGVRAAVLAHMGLAVASEWMFSPELQTGAVRPVLTAWTLPGVDLWALHAAGRKPTARATAFAQFVAAKLAAASPAGLPLG